MNRKAIILLILAALAFGSCFFCISRIRSLWSEHNYTPLRVPMKLEDGEVVEKTLHLDVPSESDDGWEYHVEVECKRTMPFETLERHLSNLVVSCFVTIDGVATNVTKGPDWRGWSSTRDTLAPIVASFRSPPAEVPFKFVVDSAPVELRQTEPRLVVTIEHFGCPSCVLFGLWQTGAQLCLLACTLLLLSAIVVQIVHWIRRRKKGIEQSPAGDVLKAAPEE